MKNKKKKRVLTLKKVGTFGRHLVIGKRSESRENKQIRSKYLFFVTVFFILLAFLLDYLSNH